VDHDEIALMGGSPLTALETGVPQAFWIVSCFLLGAVIGSFLNVVIVRLPRDMSLVSPRSSCPKCGAEIRAYDNVPLISYVLLGGKCRDCGNRISARYPVVELLTATLFALICDKYGPTFATAIYCALVAAMIAICFIDLEHMVIPDCISLNFIPIGMLTSIAGALPGMDWQASVAGLALGGAALYVPALIYEWARGVEGLGGGDVKLLAMIGAFTGPYGVIFTLFFSSTAGSLAGLAGMVGHRATSTSPIPFGPFLTGAATLYLLCGDRVIAWFFGFS
jgi:leader peptidase (prepilin peptidase)/N-methyltransferase